MKLKILPAIYTFFLLMGFQLIPYPSQDVQAMSVSSKFLNNSGSVSEPSSRYFSYRLGETEIKLERYGTEDKTGLTYFHPHEDEATSSKIGHQIIATHGGRGYFLEHGGERLISFTLKNKKYLIDPNRMFSLKGIKDNLKKYGNYSDEAANAVFQFAMWLSGMISSGQVLAVHNNHNQGYNVLSYLKNGKPVEGVDAIYINKKESTGNFIYTNNRDLFVAAKVNGINAVLQGDAMLDDGSYSVFAQRQGIDYTNVETKIGDEATDTRLIAFVNRFYNAPKVAGGKTWPLLKPGDTVDLVATSSYYNPRHLKLIQEVLKSQGLVARAKYAVEGDPSSDLWYSATDKQRLDQFMAALGDPASKAVWGIRGGSGTTNFLPMLLSAVPPNTKKPVIGFSDVTGVHIFLNSKWNWPTIHGVLAEFNSEVNRRTGEKINNKTSIKTVVDLLMGRKKQVEYHNLQPLNEYAESVDVVNSTLIGGNLTLVSTSLGTNFHPTNRYHILILEGIGNNMHQLERFLDQIAYAQDQQYTKAVILGEFLQSEKGDPEETVKLTDFVLKRFANKLPIPVFRLNNFGHGQVNEPLPLGTKASIQKTKNGFKVVADAR